MTAICSVRAYGEPACFSLTTYWSHKMGYCYALWVSSGFVAGYCLDDEAMRAYVPPPEADAFADGASEDLKRLLRAVHTLRPRCP